MRVRGGGGKEDRDVWKQKQYREYLNFDSWTTSS